MNKLFFQFLFLVLIITGCTKSEELKPASERSALPVVSTKAPQRTIMIIPLDNFSTAELNNIAEAVKSAYSLNVVVSHRLNLPQRFVSQHRKRYRADSIIAHLRSLHGGNTITVGIIKSDISTTVRGVRDWGVMGLGYMPGNACVISTYRLRPENRSSQFSKVVIHEIGHNFGLPHCPVKTCLMRDAKGGNPLNEEKGFCVKCKATLKSKNINARTEM